MKSANRHTLIVTFSLFAVLGCLLWVGTANAAKPRVFAIDGGPVGSLPGVTVRSFGHGPADPAAAEHAEMIVGILKDGLPRVGVTLLEALPAVDYAARDRQVAEAIDYAADQGARVVNVSMGKPVRQPRTCRALRRASGTLYVIGAGNDGLDLDRSGFWPAVCPAPNTLVVGMTDEEGKRRPESNFGSPVDVFVPAGSTSEAAAYTSVRVMRLALRHPDASAVQLRRMAIAAIY